MFRELCSYSINLLSDTLRRVWRYQRGNQNPYIEKEWLKEKVQNDKQRWEQGRALTGFSSWYTDPSKY
jgi:hypothetical protein